MKKFRGMRGSTTLEATIIFPVILLLLMLLMSFCTFLFQMLMLQSLADSLAGRIAYTYNNPGKVLETGYFGRDDFKATRLYWRFYGNEDKEMEGAANAFVQRVKGKYLLSPGKAVSVKLRVVENLLIYKKLEVTLATTYKNPAGGLFAVFGVPRTFVYKATAVSNLNETTDFIRSADFVIDTVNTVDQKYLGGKIETFQEGISSKFNHIFDLVNKFFKGE